jgi:sporulation protein YlmC with PRC-barrel domain
MMKLQTQPTRWALAPRAVAVLAALPLAVSAQQAPIEPPPAEGPVVPRTERGPDAVPPSAQAPAAKPSEAPVARDLVGLNVFSSDGTRVGEVRGVNTGPSGDIVALHVRTGGFLGFGGRIVAIPQGKFIRSGQSIRIDLDSDEVTGLPNVKD